MEKQVTLGAKVLVKEGVVGTVDKVVVDPGTHQPGYLVVKRGRVQARRIVVPVSLVAEVSPEAVTLAITRNGLETYPDYEITVQYGVYRRPTPLGYPRAHTIHTPPSNQGFVVLTHRSVPDASVSVEKGMAVYDAGGAKVSQVQGVILDKGSRQATHLVLRCLTPLSPRDRIMPVDLIADVEEGMVHLRITADDISGLTPYRPESQLDAGDR